MISHCISWEPALSLAAESSQVRIISTATGSLACTLHAMDSVRTKRAV